MTARYNWIFYSGILALSLLASVVWAAPNDAVESNSQKSDLALEELDAELAALEAELATLDPESNVDNVLPESDEELQNEEDYELAGEAYATGLLSRAVDHWTAAAQRNYAPAQARLGLALDYTEADVLATGWFMMAASQGSAEGAFHLSGMYLKGEGVKKNREKAAYWMRFSAEKDYAPAIKLMDEAYSRGDKSFLGEAAKDEQQAEYWAQKQEVIGGAAAEAEAERTAYEQKKYIENLIKERDAATAEESDSAK